MLLMLIFQKPLRRAVNMGCGFRRRIDSSPESKPMLTALHAKPGDMAYMMRQKDKRIISQIQIHKTIQK